MTLSRCENRCAHRDRCVRHAAHEGLHMYADHGGGDAPCYASPEQVREGKPTAQQPALTKERHTVRVELAEPGGAAKAFRAIADVIEQRTRDGQSYIDISFE